MSSDPAYWRQQTPDKPFYPDMTWNLPERPRGSLTLLGGCSSGFQAVVRTAEFAGEHLPLERVQMVVPASLEPMLTNLDHVLFAPAGPAGAFAQSEQLEHLPGDALLLIGDASKNAEAATALNAAAAQFAGPVVLARDAVDLLAPHMGELLLRPNLAIVASLIQLQKVFRALYYPKMLLLSSPLLAVLETLHKFTLSYPATLLTLHEGQILVAQGGEIISTGLSLTDFSPLSLWNGTLAARVAAYQIFAPDQPLATTAAAVLA